MGARSVLVLGAGIAGLAVAHALRHRLDPGDAVTVVDARRSHEFRPALLQVAIGAAAPAKIRRDLAPLGGQGIRVVTGRVRAILPESRAAVVDGRVLTADALVVALGARMMPAALPGLEAAHNLYTAEGAAAVASGLATLDRGRLAVVAAPGPYTCPLGPYEFAMMADHELRRRGRRDAVDITVFSADAELLPGLGGSVNHPLGRWLAARGVAQPDRGAARRRRPVGPPAELGGRVHHRL